MPDMNDFYAFKSTSGSGNSSGGGCSSTVIIWIVIIYTIISIIGKF